MRLLLSRSGVIGALLALAGCLGPAGMRREEPPPPPLASESTRELPPARAASVRMTLAEELVKKGEVLSAIVQYEQARKQDPHLSDQVSRKLGVLYDQADDPARALVEFQAALKAYPKDVELLTDVGYSYYNRGNWDEAERHLRQALALDARHKRARVNLALTLGQQGKYDESLQEFAQVVSPAEARANLAFILLTQGKREEAKQAYREALALEPNLRVAQAALERLEQPPPPNNAAAPGAVTQGPGAPPAPLDLQRTP